MFFSTCFFQSAHYYSYELCTCTYRIARVAPFCWNGKHSMAMAIMCNVRAIVGLSVLGGYFIYSCDHSGVSQLRGSTVYSDCMALTIKLYSSLFYTQTVSREMRIKASNGTEYFLVDVIAQILKYLKNELIKNHLSGIPLRATDFDWVVTVPAIWKARGKQMMREAGYKVSNHIDHQYFKIAKCTSKI